jgi:hypothetical protein
MTTWVRIVFKDGGQARTGIRTLSDVEVYLSKIGFTMQQVRTIHFEG